MAKETRIKENTYFDSVSMMTISTKANEVEGVKQAMIGMGTDMNKEVIRNVGLDSPEMEAAGTGDLMIAIETESEHQLANAFEKIDELFQRKKRTVEQTEEKRYKTIENVVENNEHTNIAVISVNGIYAAREARKALKNGLHVMLFSDNVSIEDEVELKEEAHEKGLLMMGPDCGTAIINNVGLCFANKVNRGNIGIVGASGTGSQELSVRIQEFGGGISQLIGTGGRDLSEEVGGIMMMDGIQALEADEETDVIVLISKPPAKKVAEKILKLAGEISKPVVVFFLGEVENTETVPGVYFAKRSKEAAIQAVILAGIDEETLNKRALNLPLIEEIKGKLKPEQQYIRGLFCGGTLCDEAMFAAMEYFDNVYSNIHPDQNRQLKNNNVSQEHTFIDFGSDEFTSGKPHPMIDPSTRIDRFLQEAKDPEVGVIILDFVLGYGAHPDPVGVMLPAIEEAKSFAEEEGRHLEILGYVLGTELDEQNLTEQIKKLEDVGVTISSSSQNTGLLARGFVQKEVTK